MEKVEIDNFFSLYGGYLGFSFTEMCIEQSSVFHVNFVQITDFDWLPGRHKALIFEYSKIL